MSLSSYESSDPARSLTIADPRTDQYMGSCGAGPDGQDIEVYYTPLPEHQGNGFATEAGSALIEHLKSTTDATVLAYVVAENIQSLKVAERAISGSTPKLRSYLATPNQAPITWIR